MNGFKNTPMNKNKSCRNRSGSREAEWLLGIHSKSNKKMASAEYTANQ